MKAITCYQSRDGKIFESMEKCTEYETKRQLDLEKSHLVACFDIPTYSLSDSISIYRFKSEEDAKEFFELCLFPNTVYPDPLYEYFDEEHSYPCLVPIAASPDSETYCPFTMDYVAGEITKAYHCIQDCLAGGAGNASD